MCITRRDVLRQGGALAALGLLSGVPKISFANLPTENRFVLVILRGALDGLAAVAPYGDPAYASMRTGLALANPGEEGGVIDLDGFFGLHPSMAPLHTLYANKQLAMVHAVSSPYRERSHFDAQNLLENGTLQPGGHVGWLNKFLVGMQAKEGGAIALNQQVPLVLQGQVQVASWTPKKHAPDESSAYMQSLKAMYAQDPVLAQTFAEGMRIQTLAEASLTKDDMMASGNAKGPEALAQSVQAAGAFLARADGPRVAVLEVGGWDTHLRQGTVNGQFATRLADLSRGLAAFPAALGAVWDKTVVVVVTEFGRTVRMNGTGGTDHGTGSVSFVMGGRVNGGKVYGQWPGLAEAKLYQNRDLMPTTDMRSIFKTALYSHMGVPNATLDTIFPESGPAGMIPGLLG